MKIKSGIMRFIARKFFLSSNSRDYFLRQCSSSAQRARDHKYPSHLFERYLSNSLLSLGLASERRCTRLSDRSRRSQLLRFYSSESDGKNVGKQKENSTERMSHNDAQAQLGEQDQTEGHVTETPSVESKTKKSPLSTRGARFRDEFLKRIVPWEKITVSLDTFPYYIHERTKTLLVECMASHLKQKKFRKYGGRLASSSGRILLQSIPGTSLYRDRLVSALAREFQVPLLKLDSSVLPPYDFSQDCTDEDESDEERLESDEESDEEFEDEDDTSDEEEDTTSDEEGDTKNTAKPCKKCASAESGSSSSSSKSETAKHSEKVCLLKEGDRVKYVGPTTSIKEANNRTLSSGQRGEVHEVNGDKVAVVFNINGLATKEAEKDEKSTETAAQASVTWLDVKHVKHDCDAQTHDCYIAMEVLYEVLESQQPIVVYFPNSFVWLSRAASKKIRKEFVGKVQEMFDQLSGRVVLICGQNKWEAGSVEMEKFPVSLKQYIKGLKATKRYDENEMCKLFTNVMYLKPPKDQDLLKTFVKQIEEDRITVISEGNLSEMHKVFKEHNLLCMDLEHANTNDMILTKQSTSAEAEKVVGWATNHYLSSCLLPCVKGDRLHVPHESLKLAILRLKDQETESKKNSKSIESLASDYYERKLVSAVVRPGDIGVKFDDVGALEDVKKALNELVILPMKRPELFSHGNLLRPCKGILLFGPPGTGKTLLAKALATEAGANFINVTAASLLSMWYGQSEKYTRALFTFAGKLAPVIIFVDEVDGLLSARGGGYESDVTRSMRNEFMAAWDGLMSKESQRILVLGATNRPFDLDDAVIRRMPRRIYVDLPDVENRSKILKVLLAKENLESGFSFEQLAEATEGYSGSDLKNLCVAAGYRPVQELLEKESKGEKSDGVPAIRPLNVNDFIHSKAKVGPSVAYNAISMHALREWNEQFGEGGNRRKSPFGF